MGLCRDAIEALCFAWWESKPPNESTYRAWRKKRDAQLEEGEFEPREEIVSVQVLEGGPDKAWPLEMPMGLPDDESEALIGPPVVLEIKVEDAGMLAHLNAGASWDSLRPDHFDEQALFRGGPNALRKWKRAKTAKPRAPRPPPQADRAALARVVEESEGSVVVEFVTRGDMPSLDLVRWCSLLADVYPRLVNTHPDYRGRLVRSVTLIKVDAAAEDEALVLAARNPKPSAAELRKDNLPEPIDLRPCPVHGVYRVEANERAWIVERNPRPSGDWFRPFADPLSRMPKPTSASELEEFRELLEMARMDGPASVVDMLFDGLNGTFEIVQLSLQEALVVDAPITCLEGRLGPLIGSYDIATACAALRVAKRIASEGLLGSVVLATWRMEQEVARAAVEALRALPKLPAWAEKRLAHEPFLPAGMSAEEALATLHRAYSSFDRPHRG